MSCIPKLGENNDIRKWIMVDLVATYTDVCRDIPDAKLLTEAQILKTLNDDIKEQELESEAVKLESEVSRYKSERYSWSKKMTAMNDEINSKNLENINKCREFRTNIDQGRANLDLLRVSTQDNLTREITIQGIAEIDKVNVECRPLIRPLYKDENNVKSDITGGIDGRIVNLRNQKDNLFKMRTLRLEKYIVIGENIEKILGISMSTSSDGNKKTSTSK